MSRSKEKDMADPYPPVDVCCGGTIPVNQNYVPFSNTSGTNQTVSNCRLFPGVSVVIRPTQPGSAQNMPIGMNPLPAAGDYSFTSTCSCSAGSMPVIKVQ